APARPAGDQRPADHHAHRPGAGGRHRPWLRRRRRRLPAQALLAAGAAGAGAGGPGPPRRRLEGRLQHLLLLAAFAFALGDLVFVMLLLGRRLRLARAEERRLRAEERLRPLALAITDGDDDLPGALAPGDAPLLASLLSRYAQWLTGTSRGAIA